MNKKKPQLNQDISSVYWYHWCKERGIRLNGPGLERPPKDKALYRQQLDEERRESGERNEIEGYIGVCKRRYRLGLVLMCLKHTSEVDIHAAADSFWTHLEKGSGDVCRLQMGWFKGVCVSVCVEVGLFRRH
ncbi:MAG: transposase [Christensenellales bacterium]